MITHQFVIVEVIENYNYKNANVIQDFLMIFHHFYVNNVIINVLHVILQDVLHVLPIEFQIIHPEIVFAVHLLNPILKL